MQEHKPEVDYWGRFSATYDKEIDGMIGPDVRKNLAGILAGERDPGDAVEFGCGTGS